MQDAHVLLVLSSPLHFLPILILCSSTDVSCLDSFDGSISFALVTLSSGHQKLLIRPVAVFLGQIAQKLSQYYHLISIFSTQQGEHMWLCELKMWPGLASLTMKKNECVLDAIAHGELYTLKTSCINLNSLMQLQSKIEIV